MGSGFNGRDETRVSLREGARIVYSSDRRRQRDDIRGRQGEQKRAGSRRELCVWERRGTVTGRISGTLDTRHPSKTECLEVSDERVFRQEHVDKFGERTIP